jgi:hypothetical protein
MRGRWAFQCETLDISVIGADFVAALGSGESHPATFLASGDFVTITVVELAGDRQGETPRPMGDRVTVLHREYDGNLRFIGSYSPTRPDVTDLPHELWRHCSSQL